jgi:hypothetical protein
MEMQTSMATRPTRKGEKAVVKVANGAYSLDATLYAYPDGTLMVWVQWTDHNGKREVFSTFPEGAVR